MVGFLLRVTVRFLLGLRYRVRVEGLTRVAQRGRKGILFLPNHPALIDPVVVVSELHKDFGPQPLADQDQINRPIAGWVTKQVGVRPVMDMAKHGASARDQVLEVVRSCAEGLRAGDNILLYPSGHLYRSRNEDLRGNSAVELILKEVPEARVVLVRTTGLWGSSFGFASGRVPVLARELRAHIGTLLKNLIFFTPRRKVRIELHEPDDFPRQGDRNEMNAFMEAYYNEDPPPATYVPYSMWSGESVRELPDPEFGGLQGDVSLVSESARELVSSYLREATGEAEINDDQELARDLGLDSLARADLALWVAREFGHADIQTDALKSVHDVLLATRGEAISARPAELKPVPKNWFAPRSSERVDVPPGETIPEVFLAQALRDPSRAVLADQNSGMRTYRDLLTAIHVMRPKIAALEGTHVGIMLPASVGATVAYLATLFAGKTPVMINWTTGVRNITHGLELTGTRHVLTAGALLTRLAGQGIDLSALDDRFVKLEEVGASLTTWDKVSAALAARFGNGSLRNAVISDVAAVLFTSGSEALPKAVPLRHSNLLTNTRDVVETVNIRRDDIMLGFLPPFHSFGLAVNTMLPLLTGLRVCFHTNPTEGSVLAALCEAYQATVVLGTPTFMNGIARVARQGQLDTLRLAVTGAESCPPRVYHLLAERCPNAKVLEGYGITECSPIVSVNSDVDPRPHSIGRVLPSVEYSIVHPETLEPVGSGETGLLLVRGPSIFDGYLGDAPSPFIEAQGKTWYRTGDLVELGDDGFLDFRGRLKRFIKLGGEMISLPAIEDVLSEHYPAGEEGPTIAIEATPSEESPEIILFATQPLQRADINRLIRGAELSALHNVARVVEVDEIPVLGTGKTNYRALKELLAAEQANA